MKLSEYAISQFSKIIKDRFTGRKLISIFNKWGARDIYDDLGLPDIGKLSGQRPSKTEYIKARLLDVNNTDVLRCVIVDLLTEVENIIPEVNLIIEPESYTIKEDNGKLIILGNFDNKENDNQAEVNAHFNDIQNKIITEIRSARVSIIVVMAWFTNEVIARELIDKYNQGLYVSVVMFDDGVNKLHGVDLGSIPTTRIRSTKGGIMHNKFCVIDNQVVITGSYNWSSNAEFKNDENISIIRDNNIASDYSVKYRELVSGR